MLDPNLIIYEQPLNEIIRACLRLEQLFCHIDHHLDDKSRIGVKNAVTYVIHLLNVVDRPDLKAKLAKEISQQLYNISRIEDIDPANKENCEILTHNLQRLSRNLIDCNGKIGQRLRNIELLNTLKMHVNTPGGGCHFDVPIYHYWLQQPIATCHEIIRNWLTEFDELQQATDLVLKLVRKNAKHENRTAIHGFHQELLDHHTQLRMIRIAVPPEFATFPEISIGRHFFSVRFFTPTIDRRPPQFSENIPFVVAYCNL